MRADGELWAATAQGLARFDGTGFEPHATPGLWDMDVADVAVDSAGASWFATRAGLHRYDEGSWTRFMASASPLPSDTVDSVAATPGGGC